MCRVKGNISQNDLSRRATISRTPDTPQGRSAAPALRSWKSTGRDSRCPVQRRPKPWVEDGGFVEARILTTTTPNADRGGIAMQQRLPPPAQRRTKRTFARL